MTYDTTVPQLRVLIAGGGVAGLEALLALRELAGPRVALALITPDSEFVYAPLSVCEPFAGASAVRRPIAEITDDVGAELIADTLGWVAPGQHAAFTTSGSEISYDVLIVALGARRDAPYEKVTTFRGGDDSESVHGLIEDVEQGYSSRIAFVVPPGITWPLPLYELALMTAARAREMSAAPELTVVTPEEKPLGVFGADASAEVAALLGAAGIAVESSTYAEVADGRHIRLRPSGKTLEVDRIVALPTLHGPALQGLPTDDGGFIPTDSHGRVVGVADVYAAGDGVRFPVKQGGIAAQQADAIAEVVAKRAGAPIEPRSFRPVLRGMLLTGGAQHFLKGDVRGVSEASTQCLWWPPTKIAARYLAPYLAGSQEPARDTEPEGRVVEVAMGEREEAR